MARVIRPKDFDALALPAAGANAEGSVLQLASSQIIICLAIMAEYTRGGAAGSVAFGLDISDKDGNWFQWGVSAEAAPSTGVDLNDVVQRKNWLYKATGATLERICFHVWENGREGPLFNRGVRMTAKEVGNVGAPGTVTARFMVET